jgi:phosphoenolpyruvate synthase/pyruvate phosphate dikinase
LKLSDLRATDSGKIVGPKAAKLGELKHHYPEAVTEGLAIPFGIFRDLLEQPMDGMGVTVFEWMQSEYARLGALEASSTTRREQTELFRAKLEMTIRNADPGDEFRTRLRANVIDIFGPDGAFGVFVRSDTNVEDLPEFTGAGLNLTVANVVGVNKIIRAISDVWASPFSARSFAWRQTLMDKPEHVYPAVLLLRSVDVEKSGVLVTQDIDTGDRDWLSVAVNEGVGGAVDGQSAESLRINIVTGEVRLMAAATASLRRKVDLSGGVKKLPVSSSEYVLRSEEIDQLINLAKELPTRFPAIVDASGKPTPADIEFGFLDGHLKLFQIRPFLENEQTRENSVLQALDQSLAERANLPVALDEPPLNNRAAGSDGQ